MAISTIDNNGVNLGQLGSRNLITNGAMRINQRGNFTLATTGSPEYGGPDRYFMWSYTSTEQVVADISQATDVPSGQGFSYSYKVDVTTAESAVAAEETLTIGQFIEAQNVQHLEYGTSSAKNVTVSFWIKSTKTGTYCFSLNQPDGSRVYVKEYTVDASDTWEKKIITIPGDASGTINNDNGRGLWLQWVLMAGTNRQGTANAWRGSQFELATSNQVNAVDNASNNIYLTGVQLEVGDTATPFEHRSYGAELALCQRYYYYVGKVANNVLLGGYMSPAQDDYLGWMTFPVQMRASPSFNKYGTWTVSNCGQPNATFFSEQGCTLYVSVSPAGSWYAHTNSTDDYMEWDAEL